MKQIMQKNDKHVFSFDKHIPPAGVPETTKITTHTIVYYKTFLLFSKYYAVVMFFVQKNINCSWNVWTIAIYRTWRYVIRREYCFMPLLANLTGWDRNKKSIQKMRIAEIRCAQNMSAGWSGSSSQGRRNSCPTSCSHLLDTAKDSQENWYYD